MKCCGEYESQKARDVPNSRGQNPKEEGREAAETLSLKLGKEGTWRSDTCNNWVADLPSHKLEDPKSFLDLDIGSEDK